MPSRVGQSRIIGREGDRLSASLARGFEKYFDVVPADTPELVREAYRLRHQVYCVENDFEPRERNANGLEIDAYDTRSIHCLLYFTPARRFIGTVRLVLPDPRQPQRSFPLQHVCGARLPAIDDTAEISRFCISRAQRWSSVTTAAGPTALSADGDAPVHSRSAQDRRRILSYAALGLMRGLVEMSVARDVRHWCVLAAPALLRFLAGFGIRLDPVGPAVEFHGPRVPCYSNLRHVLSMVRPVRPDVWRILTDSGRLTSDGGSAAWPNGRRRPGSRQGPRAGVRLWPGEASACSGTHSHYT